MLWNMQAHIFLLCRASNVLAKCLRHASKLYLSAEERRDREEQTSVPLAQRLHRASTTLASKNHVCNQSAKRYLILAKMPWSPAQHRLFQAAAHNPAIAQSHGMTTAKASSMAAEGVKRPAPSPHAQALAKALTKK